MEKKKGKSPFLRSLCMAIGLAEKDIYSAMPPNLIRHPFSSKANHADWISHPINLLHFVFFTVQSESMHTTT